VLQANYFEKISLILIFSLVSPNALGLLGICEIRFVVVSCAWGRVPWNFDGGDLSISLCGSPPV